MARLPALTLPPPSLPHYLPFRPPVETTSPNPPALRLLEPRRRIIALTHPDLVPILLLPVLILRIRRLLRRSLQYADFNAEPVLGRL